MPRSDPIPTPRASAWRRFRRIMRWMSLVAILTAAAAVWFVTEGETEIRIHMLIATALGAGLTVLLGTALMTLAFLSSSSGHDSKARGTHDETQGKQE